MYELTGTFFPKRRATRACLRGPKQCEESKMRSIYLGEQPAVGDWETGGGHEGEVEGRGKVSKSNLFMAKEEVRSGAKGSSCGYGPGVNKGERTISPKGFIRQ